MKASIKCQWLEALRSGKYKQTKERLRRGDSFCCLGVLCDLVKEPVNGSWIEDAAFMTESQDAEGLSLPVEVRRFVNVKESEPLIIIPEDDPIRQSRPKVDQRCRETPLVGVPLTFLNDAGGLTFAEIADLIEKYIPEDPETE